MIYENVLELIGKTPLVRYSENVLLKLEYFNPSGSIKDRASYSMLKNANLDKDTVVIEPTSGNTGIGLAMCCAVMGLRLIICMPESMSEERRKLIAAYGAELVLTPKEKGMQGAVEKAFELAKTYPKTFIPMQFSNPNNPLAHQQTAKELLDDTDGRVDIVVAGIGTGGTAYGLKRFLEGKKIFGVEPAESPLLTAGHAGPHKIQGIGANFVPEIAAKGDELDGILTVNGDDAISKSKELAKKYGVFCGISAGANVIAAEELAKKYPDKLIVAVIPDTGERYLSVW